MVDLYKFYLTSMVCTNVVNVEIKNILAFESNEMNATSKRSNLSYKHLYNHNIIQLIVILAFFLILITFVKIK